MEQGEGQPSPATDMATKKAKPAPAGPTEARALVDLPAYGVACGALLVADAAEIAALVAAGQADDHPGSVAYAKTLKD